MKPCRICNCIEPLLVSLASAEAMEHNTVVGKEAASIGQDVKRLISEEQYDELLFEHNWLEYPLIEPIATLAFHISMRDVEEKCSIPTSEVRGEFKEATVANDKKQFGAAQQKFIEVKGKILNLATELCKES